MLGLIRGSGSPPESRGWPHSVPWRLGGFFFLLLLEGAGCLANPSSTSGGVVVVFNNNNNNNNLNNQQQPSVNIYMSLEEVKQLLGATFLANDQVEVLGRSAFCGAGR
ncbi:hypothetical protein EYF80_015622 [Liparis tanakae]|uniref:Uncharacterized protein n=1 Tax=Liparis tanakae TaxID=230148 RepID=A0A4Z2I853_9TELE|nr:hypothetical protein EYF80_015622 [Liparis tanakae]